MARRMIETNITAEDVKIEGSLRPQTLDDYIGQSKVKENLKILGVLYFLGAISGIIIHLIGMVI